LKHAAKAYVGGLPHVKSPTPTSPRVISVAHGAVSGTEVSTLGRRDHDRNWGYYGPRLSKRKLSRRKWLRAPRHSAAPQLL